MLQLYPEFPRRENKPGWLGLPWRQGLWESLAGLCPAVRFFLQMAFRGLPTQHPKMGRRRMLPWSLACTPQGFTMGPTPSFLGIRNMGLSFFVCLFLAWELHLMLLRGNSWLYSGIIPCVFLGGPYGVPGIEPGWWCARPAPFPLSYHFSYNDHWH